MTEDKYHIILKQYWGYDDFRGIQQEIIHSIGSGKDTLGLMPTGGGKSIAFQVPALAQEGICIVITPLIALMKDQVENLKKRGIKAAAIYSGLTHNEILVTLENCIFGDYKFLYVSPERLSSELFLTKLKRMRVSFITVDEAHCISQWGYDFRPSYIRIADLRKVVPQAPVLALTATATPEVVKDIQDKLLFRQEHVFKMSFARKNLAYVVRHTEDKESELLHIINSIPGTVIVYCRSRKGCRDLAAQLEERGLTATFYHAGLSNCEKDERQRLWQTDQCRVMVATNAFGMGIDKADVRFVAHTSLPKSIENYVQEIGRAGRDGQKAEAWLCFSGGDAFFQKKRIAESEAEDWYKNLSEVKQDVMQGYAESTECRRNLLLAYFGEKSKEKCGQCDNCRVTEKSWDASTAVKKFLSTVWRSYEKSKLYLNAAQVIEILQGIETPFNRQHDFQELSTWKIGVEFSESQLRAVYRYLLLKEALGVEFTSDNGLFLTDKSRRFLSSSEPVFLSAHGSGQRKSRNF